MGSILAVDVGLKTGFALYGQDGKLRWYRSKNYGKTAPLRRDIGTTLRSIPDLLLLVIEGGGPISRMWEREAERVHIAVRKIQAEEWRKRFLYSRERVRGIRAKQTANALARRIIRCSDLPRPTSLRHDTAEAILIGLWAVMDMGWLTEVPREIRY